MKILHLMKDYKPTIGGSVVRNSNMIENYLKLTPEDKAYITNLDGYKYEAHSVENGVDVYRAKTLSELIEIAAKLVRDENIEIIQSHNFRFLFAAFMARFKSKQKTKIYVEIHAMYHMSWYKELLSRLLLKKVDGIVVLADCAKQYLIEEYKLKSKKITVIRNGIDGSNGKIGIQDSELSDGIEALKKKYTIVLYTGSFYEWQGVNFLADRFDKLLEEIQEIAFVMIGNGPDYDYVKDRLLKTKYNDRILLHPGISKQELLSVYDLADVLIIPRVKNLSTNTAVPLKVIEAMEYGKCIVSANDNGLKEVLNETNAFIFESEDVDSLINQLKKAVESPERRNTVSSKAKNDAKELFVSWEDSALQMKKLYGKEQG